MGFSDVLLYKFDCMNPVQCMNGTSTLCNDNCMYLAQVDQSDADADYARVCQRFAWYRYSRPAVTMFHCVDTCGACCLSLATVHLSALFQAKDRCNLLEPQRYLNVA